MKNTRLYERLMMDKNLVQPGTVRMTWLGTSGIFVMDGKRAS